MTTFQDKTLVCRDCGKEFQFTAGEQEFYQSRSLGSEPSRCQDCRLAKRRDRSAADVAPREMHPAVCASCGKDCEVPFQPKGDRPVYCNECFTKMRNRR